ncbi:hypothetical protein [Lihuaxuella thermophila]|uniref:Uncharacterized protein n=1 Tax=Lihuaxuella thermophila TaxID=1173111 RepID=A0A1H8ERB8_9BACL|nr:hypothetical protein [Lihuaxuella thermophila]SEN22059.1 hypothetical protein SAMN05444955_107131 [Lihuaxuella thermophila]
MRAARSMKKGYQNEIPQIENSGVVFKSKNCTYITEWGNKLGYEQTKDDLCRVLAKIELGI